MLPRAQIIILETLRHRPQARFRDLRRPTGLESDVFKFHVRKLATLGHIVKTATGSYELTTVGKEFANNLDEAKRSTQKQPKLSMAIVARREQLDGTSGLNSASRYLMQRRLRQPYYGFWGLISGPVPWGEEIEAAAERELLKQTGLQATCRVRSFYRQRDYMVDPETLLEDKLFAVMEATGLDGETTNDWAHGHNRWMTLAELQAQEDFFPSTADIIEAQEIGAPYASAVTRHSHDEY